MFNGIHLAFIWHIDDLKLTHVAKRVVEGKIDKLNEKFGDNGPLTRAHGKRLEYLGMTLDNSAKGKVKFQLSELPTHMIGAV